VEPSWRSYREGVRHVGTILRRHALDLLIVALALAGAIAAALRTEPQRAPLWITAPAIALTALVLLGRHRFPYAAPAAVWLLAAAVSFVDGRLVVGSASGYLAGLGAAALLGSRRDALQAGVGLVIVVGAAATIVQNDPGHAVGDFLFVPLGFALAWLAGFAVRKRAAEADAAEQRAVAAEREREVAARIAVAEERARIARELHDIVAHSVSVMVLQVGAVRHRLSDSLADDKDALRAVEQAGREALAEMRLLLGALRDAGPDVDLAPQPSLDSLDALLEKVRLAGLPVDLRVEGTPFPLPRGLDVSAYRIVQEALTNTLKHAHARHADVTVKYRADGLQLEVRDDGVGSTASDGRGHGLVGVGERVKVYGGEMTAGVPPEGGFVLRARLPARDGQS
jgi:signal transduction histidine kinase